MRLVAGCWLLVACVLHPVGLNFKLFLQVGDDDPGLVFRNVDPINKELGFGWIAPFRLLGAFGWADSSGALHRNLVAFGRTSAVKMRSHSSVPYVLAGESRSEARGGREDGACPPDVSLGWDANAANAPRPQSRDRSWSRLAMSSFSMVVRLGAPGDS